MATDTLVLSGFRVTDPSSNIHDFQILKASQGALGYTLETRPWEPGDPAQRWRIPLHPWIGGLHEDRLYPSPRTYAKANADATYPNMLLFPPLINNATGANLNAPVKLVVFDSKIFAIGGRYVYMFDPSTNTLSEDEDLGSGVSAVDAAVFNNELVVACGESTKIFTRATSGTYTQASDNTFAIALGVVGSQLWRAEETNEISFCNSSPRTLANWSPADGSEYTAGDETFAVHTIIDYGGIPWPLRGDGAYAPDPQSRFKNQTPQIKRTPHADNCFPPETLVGFDKSVQRIFKRPYSGELVEITTALGHKLAGTPNHPVLTDRGWVALGDLVEGDNVVAHRDVKPMLIIDPDVDGVYSPIGDLFSSLLEISPAERKPIGPMDFHGDGQNGDVDVVTVDWELLDRLKPTLPQGMRDLLFPSPNPGLTPKMALATEQQGVLAEAPGLLSPGGSHGGPMLFETEFATPVDSSRRVVSSGKPTLPQDAVDHSLVNPNLPGDVPCAPAPNVLFDGVVLIERRAWSGHVYNLQTASSKYMANGIVVHNCKGAFVAQGALWLPCIDGLYRVKPGKSHKRGPEVTFRPSYRFRVRGGVEYGEFIYLLVTDSGSSGDTFICKMSAEAYNEDLGHEYIYQEWARLGSTDLGYAIGVTTAGTSPKLCFTTGTDDFNWIDLGRGGGRDADDGLYRFGTAMSLETGLMQVASDVTVESTLVGVDVALDYSRVNESLTLAYRWDATCGCPDSTYTNLLDEAESGGGTAAITSTSLYDRVTRYANANNSGHHLEVRFTGTAAYGGSANAAVTTTDTTLTDTRLSLTTNAAVGLVVTCDGKTMTVTSNTSDTFTGSAWSGGGNPGNGDAWSLNAGGFGVKRPVIKEAWAHGYTHPVQTDIISLAVVGDDTIAPGRAETLRLFRYWQNEGSELLVELEGYERSRNTRFLVGKVEEESISGSPGNHKEQTRYDTMIRVQLVRVDRAGGYAT